MDYFRPNLIVVASTIVTSVRKRRKHLFTLTVRNRSFRFGVRGGRGVLYSLPGPQLVCPCTSVAV